MVSDDCKWPVSAGTTPNLWADSVPSPGSVLPLAELFSASWFLPDKPGKYTVFKSVVGNKTLADTLLTTDIMLVTVAPR